MSHVECENILREATLEGMPHLPQTGETGHKRPRVFRDGREVSTFDSDDEQEGNNQTNRELRNLKQCQPFESLSYFERIDGRGHACCCNSWLSLQCVEKYQRARKKNGGRKGWGSKKTRSSRPIDTLTNSLQRANADKVQYGFRRRLGSLAAQWIRQLATVTVYMRHRTYRSVRPARASPNTYHKLTRFPTLPPHAKKSLAA